MIERPVKLYVGGRPTFLTFFTFFQNSKKTWLFTFFWVVAHVFSNTGCLPSCEDVVSSPLSPCTRRLRRWAPASWPAVGVVESARVWSRWLSGHVSASLSARRTRTYGPACGGRPESRRNTRRAAARVDETDNARALSLLPRCCDAVFLERINDLADVLSVVVCIKLKGTENTVRRRTDAGEK